MAESVTERFFGKLRHLATTLEREAMQLEHEFNKEDSDSEDYEDTNPMKVLHETNSEIRTLKEDIQVTINRAHSKEQDIAGFLKACKLLQQKTKSDLDQIKDVFEKYGYKPPMAVYSETEQGMENLEVDMPGDSVDNRPESEHNKDVPATRGLENVPASGDVFTYPQLSAFGLSQYQFYAPWGHVADKLQKTKPTLVEEPKCVSKDMSDSLVLPVPKTPKWASWADGYHNGMNNDYTMALFNMKVPGKPNELQRDGIEGKLASLKETQVTEVPTTPAPPVRLSSSNEYLHSPAPPAFCTPGLKTVKQEKTVVPETPESEEPAISDDAATPPLPQFETPWLRKCARVQEETLTQEVPKIEVLSNKLCPEEPAAPVPLRLCSDDFYENRFGLAPPKISDDEDFLITPKRPVFTSIMDDFKIFS